jgi:RHS repeat-associated protein
MRELMTKLAKIHCVAILVMSFAGFLAVDAKSMQVGGPAGPHQLQSGETRTLLSDGRLLVMGGQDQAGNVSNGVFLQDPATGESTALPAGLTFARAWHTATVLPDGKVLVLGGIGSDGNVVSSAELFDPKSLAFEAMSKAAPAPRAFHTATLLTDGKLWVAGGVSATGQLLGTTQLWDYHDGTSAGSSIKLITARRNHAATLLADGRVLVWGGKGEGSATVANGEIYDPAKQKLDPVDSPEALLATGNSIAEMRASSPEDNAADVSVDALISLRFSRPLLMQSINGQTIVLQGPTGAVGASVIGAENGMLAFITPKSPLVPGTTYSVTLSGATDTNHASVAFAQFVFVTAGIPPQDDEWVPTSDWRTHLPDSKWQQLPPLRAPPAVTALAGQVLKLDGNPLPRVSLIIDGQKAFSDGTGRFLLKNIAAGHHSMMINATTANTRTRSYGIYEVGVDIIGGQTNALKYTIWMTPLDTAHTVTIPSPTLTETVIKSPLLPGLELHIPANTVITGFDGKIITQINITPIPLDRPPFPLPNVPVPIYFTIQPGSSYIKAMTSGGAKGATLLYPNAFHFPTGTQFNFWNYDPDSRGWYVYGQGRVDVDGSQIVPNPGVAIYEFTGAMVANPSDAPPSGPPPGDDQGQGGDPVNLATGLLVYSKTDLVVPDVIPLTLSRTYRPNDSASRSFGVGTSQPYDIYLIGTNNTTPGGGYVWEELILPDGGRIHFDRISPCTGANGYCDFADAIFEHTSTPTDYFGATIKWIGGITPWQLTKKDGTLLFFPDSDGSTTSRGAGLFGIQDRYGNIVQFTRDFTTSNLQQLTAQNGRWIKFTYDSSNRITQAQDNISRTVQYSYDSAGRLSQVTDANGGITKYSYDAFSELLTIQDQRGIFYLTNQYDSNGRVVKQTMADGGIYLFAYTTDLNTGNIVQVDATDPLGFVKRTTFNAHGYTTSETLALGTQSQQTKVYMRDPNTNLIMKTVDALQRETDYSYDPMGNVLSITTLANTAAAATTSYTYDPNFSQVATVTDPLNHVTTYQRDPNNGNLTAKIDALGNQSLYSYFPNGQLQSITDPLQHTVQFGYDHGDLVSTTDRRGNITTSFTDGVGRVIARTDSAGNTTAYTYNALNEPTQITDAKGNSSSLAYDLNGHLISVTDPLQHTTNYIYDNMDRIIKSTDALLRDTLYAYDLNGHLISKTDPKGQVTSFAFDPLGRPTFTGFNTVMSGGVPTYDSTISYRYDAAGRLLQALDSTGGTITRTFDDINRNMTETSPHGVITYAYDAAGKKSSMTLAGQPVVNYSYDNANRLTGIAQGATTVEFSYDNASRRTLSSFSNSTSIGYSYDPASHLTGITYSFGNNVVATLSYTYDPLGRKSQAQGGFASAGYDSANELVNWNGTAISYDLNGNMLSDGSNSFTWDARNQIAAINGNPVQYDALGRRTTNAAGTAFAYDGPNAVQELSGTTVTANMLMGGVDEVLSRTDASGTFTPLRDALGSTIALLDSTGATATSYTYSPFGSTVATGSALGSKFQYTGRENDGNGVYYLRGRYYNSALGRFVSRDPSGSAGSGVNLYAFVDNDPVNFTDVFGLSKQPAADPGPAVPPPAPPKKTKLKKGDLFPMDLQNCISSYGYKALKEQFDLGKENDKEMIGKTGEHLKDMFGTWTMGILFGHHVSVATGSQAAVEAVEKAEPWIIGAELTAMFSDLIGTGIKTGFNQDEIQADFEINKQVCLNDLNYEIVE